MKADMSHTPEQPYEIPWREVEHDEQAERDDEEGRDMIFGLGHVKEREWWGTPTEWKKERSDIRRRERARQELGGFGFRT